MGSDDCIKNIVTILEPLVEDLEDKKRILSDRKKELEEVSRLIAYTKDNVEMVGIYADQDIIINNLDKLKYSKDDYKASCYLLKSESENVKVLPQYIQAHDMINDILEFFRWHKAELIDEINELTSVCEKKEIEKKYYNILSCPNPLIENTNEFIEFMTNHGLSNEEIIKVLYRIIRDNMTNYELKSN